MEKLRHRVLNRPYLTLSIIIIAAFVARLLVGAFTYNNVDIIYYNTNWALGMRDGIFSCYSNIGNLNYPPLFPVLAAPLAPLLAWAKEQDIWQMLMLLIKLIPILFDVMIIPMLYFALKKQNEGRALLAAAIWAINPVTFFNSAVWGQLDGMLCFFIALTVLLYYQKRPVWATVVFAVGCLGKLQMLYLVPLVLCELFARYRPMKAIRSLLAGVGVGLAGWLPFMAGSSDLLLPFKIYFGGFGQYKEMSLYAYNLWGLPIFNNKTTETFLFRTNGLTYGHIGTFFLILLVVFVVAVYCFAAIKKVDIPAFFIAAIYLDGIFVLTSSQHERYQIPVSVLAMLCWMFFKEKRYSKLLGFFLVVPFVNEACGLINFWVDRAEWFQKSFYGWGQLIGSVLNIIVFIYFIYLLWKYFKEASNNRPSLKSEKIALKVH